MLRELRERQDAQRSQNEAKAAVLGETKEQQLAEEQGLNKAYADSVAQIASNSSLLKDGYLDAYENNLSNYYNQRRAHNTAMAGIEQGASNQWAQVANNGVGLMATGAQTLAGAVGGLKTKAPKAGVTPGEQQQMNNYLNLFGEQVKKEHGLYTLPWSTKNPVMGYPRG